MSKNNFVKLPAWECAPLSGRDARAALRAATRDTVALELAGLTTRVDPALSPGFPVPDFVDAVKPGSDRPAPAGGGLSPTVRAGSARPRRGRLAVAVNWSLHPPRERTLRAGPRDARPRRPYRRCSGPIGRRARSPGNSANHKRAAASSGTRLRNVRSATMGPPALRNRAAGRPRVRSSACSLGRYSCAAARRAAASSAEAIPPCAADQATGSSRKRRTSLSAASSKYGRSAHASSTSHHVHR